MMTFLLFAPASTKWLAWSKDRFVDIFKVDFVTFIVQSYLNTLSRYMIFFSVSVCQVYLYTNNLLLGLVDSFPIRLITFMFSCYSCPTYSNVAELVLVSRQKNANPIWRRAFSRKMFCLYDYFACLQNIMSKYITVQRYHCVQGRMGRLHWISTHEPRYR